MPFTATGTSSDEVAARADAITIAEDIKPFAVWGGPILTPAFADELAARQVLCIDCGPGATNSYFQQRVALRLVARHPARAGASIHVAEYSRRSGQRDGNAELRRRERLHERRSASSA